MNNHKKTDESLIKISKKIAYFSEEVILFEGDSNYTRIHLQTGKEKVIAKTLSAVEEEINCRVFTRISKKFLVNRKYIGEVGRGFIKLKDGRMFPISRRKRQTSNLLLSPKYSIRTQMFF